MKKNKFEKFTGVGTVFMSSIINISNFAQNIGPLDLIDILKKHLNYVTSIVEKNNGSIIQFEGDAVLAFWHPQHINPNHAQLAFNASCKVLSTIQKFVSSQKHLTYDIDIILGTGEMTGDFFGPIKAFQIVGNAMSVANRLCKHPNQKGSKIWMSQYTLELIDSNGEIEEAGIIKRNNLNDIKVFTYNSANQIL